MRLVLALILLLTGTLVGVVWREVVAVTEAAAQDAYLDTQSQENLRLRAEVERLHAENSVLRTPAALPDRPPFLPPILPQDPSTLTAPPAPPRDAHLNTAPIYLWI